MTFFDSWVVSLTLATSGAYERVVPRFNPYPPCSLFSSRFWARSLPNFPVQVILARTVVWGEQVLVCFVAKLSATSLSASRAGFLHVKTGHELVAETFG